MVLNIKCVLSKVMNQSLMLSATLQKGWGLRWGQVGMGEVEEGKLRLVCKMKKRIKKKY